MATRRQAREWALQLLFQLDHNPAENMSHAFEAFWKQQVVARVDDQNTPGVRRPGAPANKAMPHPSAEDSTDTLASAKILAFTEGLVRGVFNNLAEIDAKLSVYLQNWPLHRLGGVERNVMRLAFFELFFADETPPIVCINEAVDLAKYFSNADAGRFVNGVLDRAAKDVKRPARK